MSILKKFKKTKTWFYTLKFIVVPIYNFIWMNIINIHGRFLYFEWFKTKREFFDLEFEEEKGIPDELLELSWE